MDDVKFSHKVEILNQEIFRLFKLKVLHIFIGETHLNRLYGIILVTQPL